MIDKLINELTVALMMHDNLMAEFQKQQMQGMKRFNRYESIEMHNRINKLKNYAVEFGHALNEQPVNYRAVSNMAVTDMMRMIKDNRTALHSTVMQALKDCEEMTVYDILKEIAKDLEKEFEVFNRILDKISPIASNDIKYMLLYDFDKDLHEYMKKKEK